MMLWVEGLVIKLYQIGINGKMFKSILKFCVKITKQVKVGYAFSRKCAVENGGIE